MGLSAIPSDDIKFLASFPVKESVKFSLDFIYIAPVVINYPT